MDSSLGLYFIYVTAALYLLRKVQVRLRLSRAKHPSLRGHSKMSRRVAKLVPFYEYNEDRFFNSDDVPDDITQKRHAGFKRLREHFMDKSPNQYL